MVSNEVMKLLMPCCCCCCCCVGETIYFGLTLQMIELFEVTLMELEKLHWPQEGWHQSVSQLNKILY